MPNDFIPKYIVAANNKSVDINLFSPIGLDGISGQDFANEIQFINDRGGFDVINVRINSGGGSVIEGLAIFDAIQNSEIPVDTIVVGVAASMAGIIALAGRKVFMNAHAQIMVHAPFIDDNREPDANEKAAIISLRASLAAILVAKTNKTAKQVDKILESGKDVWISSSDAKKQGFVDEIIPIENQIAARAVDFSAIVAVLSPPKHYKGSNLSNFLNEAIDKTDDRNITVNRIAALAGIDLVNIISILDGTKKCQKVSYLDAFAKELALGIDTLKSEASKDSLRFDTNGILIDHNSNINNMKELKSFLGLSPEASDDAVFAEVKKLAGEKETAVVDLATRTGELETANETITTLTTEIEGFKAAADKLNKEAVTTTLEAAAKIGKIDKKDIEPLEKEYAGNLNGLQLILGKVKTGAPDVIGSLTRGGDDTEGGRELTEKEKDRKFSVWEKDHKKELVALMKTDPETVKAIYKKQYNIDMLQGKIDYLLS